MRWGEFQKEGNSYRGSIDYVCYKAAAAVIEPGTSKRGRPFRVLVDGAEVGDAEWPRDDGSVSVYLNPPNEALAVTFRLLRDAGKESFGFCTMD